MQKQLSGFRIALLLFLLAGTQAAVGALVTAHLDFAVDSAFVDGNPAVIGDVLDSIIPGAVITVRFQYDSATPGNCPVAHFCGFSLTLADLSIAVGDLVISNTSGGALFQLQNDCCESGPIFTDQWRMLSYLGLTGLVAQGTDADVGQTSLSMLLTESASATPVPTLSSPFLPDKVGPLVFDDAFSLGGSLMRLTQSFAGPIDGVRTGASLDISASYSSGAIVSVIPLPAGLVLAMLPSAGLMACSSRRRRATRRR